VIPFEFRRELNLASEN